jgi:hypothetical protein
MAPWQVWTMCCRTAPCEPVLVRVRLTAEDAALMEALATSLQEDLLIDPTVGTAERPTCQDDAEWTTGSRCICAGWGCVQCLGEGCP